MSVLTNTKDFFTMLYPDLCYVCWIETPIKGRKICVKCLVDLPYTDHFKYEENMITRKFWGRVTIENGAALLNYHKGSTFTDMIHRFKYEGRRQIGFILGKMTGLRMLKSNMYNSVDIMIPVPLHPSRKAKRGYNQSTEFAKGIKEIMDIPIVENLLLKTSNTTTQTDKGRMNRLENVINSFSLRNPERFAGRHFLIIDDVITTGATMEACALKLLEIPKVKISVISLALARY